MNVVLPKPGTYVLAVSGGVDSRVLLDILHKHNQDNNWKIVVAHLDHGMREDSTEDRRFVQTLAKNYDLPFVYDSINLGDGASEAIARTARYAFLSRVQRASKAKAIVTAHHRDDLIETAIINLLRGSGRKGMTSLSSRSEMLRPLLSVPKSELINYAQDQGLTWREDSTNQDDAYLRNYVRHKIVPRLDQEAINEFLGIINDLKKLNNTLDTLLVKQLDQQGKSGTITRLWFNNLPHAVALEMLASWLRSHGLRDFSKITLERLVIIAKTAQSGTQFPLRKGYIIRVSTEYLALEQAER